MRLKPKTWLIILLVPTVYALIMRGIFGIDLLHYMFSVMSIGFLMGVPFGMGYLVIYHSPIERVRSLAYCILAPMLPILFFLMITLLFGIEGWACWLMILPIFLILSVLGGGLAARQRRRRDDDKHKLKVSIVLLIPFFLSSIEHYTPFLPTRYEAYTCIDIHAAPAAIWDNVVRVRPIDEQQDHGTLTNWLGFPRPIRAELDYAGVGGSRQAIFSKGLVFREVVKEYQPEKKMHFSIAADPHNIPSTTMDEHVVIGGDYFNVLDGTYELEKLAEGSYRLHLYSHFILNTHFNFYASWWAGLIMKDIQENILQVIQTRCQR